MLSGSFSNFLIFVNLICMTIVNVECGTSKFNTKVEDFFPQDLTSVTWAHAVNSIEKLTNATDPESDVMMLEADVTMGKIFTDPIIGPNIVIMAHPPLIRSDLSFQMFIDEVLEHNSISTNSIKGIKLDFKSLEAVEPSFIILNETLSGKEINFPIWLNADVLMGPVNSTGNPVNATEFLRLAGLYRPGDTLSLGWKTRFGFSNGKDITDGEYAKEHIDEMIELLKTQTFIDQSTPITFPLRTAIASQNLVEDIQRLLDSWDKSTITLWHGGNDTVNMSKFKFLVNTLTKEKCFIDVGFEYDLVMPATASSISNYSALIALIFVTIRLLI